MIIAIITIVVATTKIAIGTFAATTIAATREEEEEENEEVTAMSATKGEAEKKMVRIVLNLLRFVTCQRPNAHLGLTPSVTSCNL
jgi:ERCC4-related helicase